MMEDSIRPFVEHAMARRTAQVKVEQRTGLLDLALIAKTAPLIGLLGAVCSVITDLRPSGSSHWEGLPQVAAGLVPALQCLLVGLLVAMASNFFYRLLQGQTNQFETEMIHQSSDLLDAIVPQPSAVVVTLKITALLFAERAMQRTIRQTDLALRSRLYHLATVAGVTPLLGFLATVYTIANECFFSLSGSQSANLATTAIGVAHSLIWTVAGLAIGSAAFFAFRLLCNQADKLTIEMHSASALLLNQLS